MLQNGKEIKNLASKHAPMWFLWRGRVGRGFAWLPFLSVVRGFAWLSFFERRQGIRVAVFFSSEAAELLLSAHTVGD